MPHHFGVVYRELFLPPVNRAMRVLDRSFFQKRIRLTAANIFNIKNQTRVKRECLQDVLDAPRIKPFAKIPWGQDGERTLLLLKPGIKVDDPSTHSKNMKWFLEAEWMKLVTYNLKLDYDYWTYDEILTATLPESLGSPVRSYQPIGHVGNLLLKPEFHPHRHIIAQVVLDKTPQLKSIVMKPLPEPGADPFLPQLPMEHLVGDLDTVVTLQEARCKLTFDFATTEYHRNMTHAHKALLASFGDSKNHIAIAEVDAGVGQLTFPAIRSHILVHANNPDPANHAALISNIPNTTPTACDPRASAFVHATNLPTREFIPAAIRTLLDRSLDPETNQVLWPQPFINPKKPRPAPRIYKFPSVFSHFVIPYSAGGMRLLDSFRGSYAGLGIGERIMPTIHVYAYHASRLPEIARKDFVSQVREGLKFPIEAGELQVECVIKGEKQMSLHRVSFKLPRRVATRARRKMRWEREGKPRWEGEGDVGKTNATKTESATESDSGVENKSMEDR